VVTLPEIAPVDAANAGEETAIRPKITTVVRRPTFRAQQPAAKAFIRNAPQSSPY
jgi:hypothetical protein